MTLRWTALPIFFLVLCLLTIVPSSLGQTESATLSGLITDPQGRAVPGVDVEVTNVDTILAVHQTTNSVGLYVVVGLKPGRYRVSVTKDGFRKIDLTDLVLNVQDVLSRNFRLQLGPVMASITVVADEAKINTTDAAVSTVIDRNFTENLPLNGRSFQTLIALSPGVVTTPANFNDPGQFSVNGQRTSANYFTVDGVSANIGVSPSPFLGQSAGGSVAGFGVTGGTNNLVSEDALQEFRIQTSTFAPEFGRTPGAQISVVTRSGTNQFHGALFEFLRNDKLDANDWFADLAHQPKPEERINDFGGVLGGPIIKNRTFFFFSYEGQRLRQPQATITTVPDPASRQSASPAIQPFLNAYPLPNIGTDTFAASFSNQTTLNATSLRIDQKINDRVALFGRYDYAPSNAITRGAFTSLNNLVATTLNIQSLTLGSSYSITPAMFNEGRFNYSQSRGTSSFRLDTFGGAAIPPDSILLPAPFTSRNAQFVFDVFGLFPNGEWIVGKAASNLQRQYNVVDNVSLQKGAHALKFGVDFRRLSPEFSPLDFGLSVFFADVPSVVSGQPSFAITESNLSGTVLFRNLGLFAQDTWKATPRLSLSYGLRWDVDFTPSSLNGPDLAAVTGINDPANFVFAPAGTPIFKTSYGNLSPRVGLAYEIRQDARSETVLRAGFGIFYDLATTQIGNSLLRSTFPFGAQSQTIPSTFPLDPPPSPPAITPVTSSATADPFTSLAVFDPHLKLPRSYQWNITVEQALGNKQSLSVGYVGSVGRRLLQLEDIISPNFVSTVLEKNAATSDYHSLQTQFHRRLSRGLQALASYTFSHSIDSASSGSGGQTSNVLVNGLGSNRGNSDFDIRHQLSAALAYAIPSPPIDNSVFRGILSNWSVNSTLQVRSAPPVDVFNSAFFTFGSAVADIRPDLVAGQPVYVTECANPLGGTPTQIPCPGGKGLNPAAFMNPPTTPTGCDPLIDFPCTPIRQGNVGRNAFRGFGAAQWDLGVRREFPVHENWRLQFRAEFFNVLNHPNFANPIGDISSPFLGQSTQLLSKGLGGNSPGSGGFASVFQIGGPRSIQFALKLVF